MECLFKMEVALMNRKLFRILALIIVVVIITETGLSFNPYPSNGKILSIQNDCYASTDVQAQPSTSDLTLPPPIIIPKASTGVNVESAEEYMGFKVIVSNNELPASMVGFTKMAVLMSSIPFDVEKNGLPYDITSFAYVHPNNTYATVVDKAGIWYVLVVLCSNNNDALGYYETSVDVIAPPFVFVPQALKGVKIKNADKIHGFKVVVNSCKLPSGMNIFNKLAVVISTNPFDVKKNGLPYNIASFAKVYPNNSYSSAVKKAGTWYVLVVLCDNNNKPLGYYEKSIYVNSVPTVQVPVITSGITVENATSYTGYDVTINRSCLPDWAQGYSRIGFAASYMKPFDISANGLAFDLNSILSYQESVEGITTIGSQTAECKWYVLLALYDEYNNPIGYMDTSVDVVNKQN